MNEKGGKPTPGRLLSSALKVFAAVLVLGLAERILVSIWIPLAFTALAVLLVWLIVRLVRSRSQRW